MANLALFARGILRQGYPIQLGNRPGLQPNLICVHSRSFAVPGRNFSKEPVFCRLEPFSGRFRPIFGQKRRFRSHFRPSKPEIRRFSARMDTDGRPNRKNGPLGAFLKKNHLLKCLRGEVGITWHPKTDVKPISRALPSRLPVPHYPNPAAPCAIDPPPHFRYAFASHEKPPRHVKPT